MPDTKLLQALPSWNGAGEHWTEWSFQVKAMLGLASSRNTIYYLDLFMMENIEDESKLNEEAQAASKELFYILALRTTGQAALQVRHARAGWGFSIWRAWSQEYAKQAEQHALGLLQSILNFKLRTQTMSDLRQSLVELDLRLQEYTQNTHQTVQDMVLIAVLVRQLPDPLKQHIELNIASFSTYLGLKQAIQRWTEVKDDYKPTVYLGLSASSSPADQDPQPMQVGMVSAKGGGEKGKWGKERWNSNKDKGGKPEKKGSEKGKGKHKEQQRGKSEQSKGKGKTKDKGKASTFQGECSYCGKWGHKRVDCWQRPTAAAVIEGDGPAQSSTPEVLALINATAEEEAYILALSSLKSGSKHLDSDDAGSWVLVDSGADAHVAPRAWMQAVRRPVPQGQVAWLSDISGASLKTYGSFEVCLVLGPLSGGIRYKMMFTACDVTHPVLSAGILAEEGFEPKLGSSGAGPTLSKNGIHISMEKKSQKYAVRVYPLATLQNSSSQGLIAPTTDIEEMDESDRTATSSAAPAVGLAVPRGETEPLVEEVRDGEPIAEGLVPDLAMHSKVEELRRRLRELDAPVWGTKAQLVERLVFAEGKHRKEAAEQRELKLRHEVSLQGDAPQELPVGQRGLAIPEPPSEEERVRHMLTHIPTARWCHHCLQGKAKSSPHGQIHPEKQSGQRPVVELDFMFLGGVGSEEPPLCALTAVDVESGWDLVRSSSWKEGNPIHDSIGE